MEKCKVLFNQTLMISTGILFGLGIQTMVDYLVSGKEVFSWQWYVPLSIVLAGFLCSLPSLLILTMEGATGKKKWGILFLHFLCVWAVLSGIGHLFRWYENFLQYAIIMVMYVLIYGFVWLVSWWLYRKEDREINEKIKDFQDAE